MTKGRKTSYTERIEIAKYCIAHDYNYKVSYNQVYDWVKRYIEGGEELLEDHRGKKKPEPELTEMDKLRAENKLLKTENKLLKAENKYKEMELEFLKKLKEIEGRRF